MAATEQAKDISHLVNVCAGFGVHDTEPRLGEDNAAALLMATDVNHGVTSRTKHIQARYFYVRQLCEPGFDEHGNETPALMSMFKVGTELQHADIFTKALEADAFERHRDYFVKHVEHNAPEPAAQHVEVPAAYYFQDPDHQHINWDMDEPVPPHGLHPLMVNYVHPSTRWLDQDEIEHQRHQPPPRGTKRARFEQPI